MFFPPTSDLAPTRDHGDGFTDFSALFFISFQYI
jgi:hypothetical protein